MTDILDMTDTEGKTVHVTLEQALLAIEAHLKSTGTVLVGRATLGGPSITISIDYPDEGMKPS